MQRRAVLVPGLMGAVNPPSLKSTSSESAAPGICKELIGQSVARLRGCNSGTDESVADRLASDLYLMYEAVQAISELYDRLDDESQDNGESTKQAIALEMTQVQLRRKQKQHSEHFASFYLLCSSSPEPRAFLIFPTHYFCLSCSICVQPGGQDSADQSHSGHRQCGVCYNAVVGQH